MYRDARSKKHKGRIKWREKNLCSKWLNMNEDLAYKIILNCSNVTETVALDNTLNVVICGQENEVCEEQHSLENTAEWNEKLGELERENIVIKEYSNVQ
jgi:hypothetical protein